MRPLALCANIVIDASEPCPLCYGTIINSGIDTVAVGGRFEGADRSYKDYSIEKLLEMAGAAY